MLGAYIAFTIKWWIGLLCIGSLNIIRIGYGAYDPDHDDKPSFLAAITHDRSGISERAIAGFLYGVIGMLPLMIYSHLWLTIPLYALGISIVSALLCALRARDFIIEPLIGATVASIIFLI